MVGVPVQSGRQFSHDTLKRYACSFLRHLGCVSVDTEYPIMLPEAKTIILGERAYKIADVFGMPLIGGPFVVECGSISHEQERKLWELLTHLEVRRLFGLWHHCPFVIEYRAQDGDLANAGYATRSRQSLIPVAAFKYIPVSDRVVSVPIKSAIRPSRLPHRGRRPPYGPRFDSMSLNRLRAVDGLTGKYDAIRQGRLSGRSLQDIADEYGVTRQRVFQILCKIERIAITQQERPS